MKDVENPNLLESVRMMSSGTSQNFGTFAKTNRLNVPGVNSPLRLSNSANGWHRTDLHAKDLTKYDSQSMINS